jgi:hypothetical protein
MFKQSIALCVAMLGALPSLKASGNGPVFGLATPVNAKGVCNIDLGLMNQEGSGGASPMLRTLFGCGITEICN